MPTSDFMLGGMTFLTAFFAILASFNFSWLLPLIGLQGTLAATLLSLLVAVMTRRALRAHFGSTPPGRDGAYGALMLVLLPLMLVGLFAPDLPGRLIFLLVDIVLAVYWWDEDRWTGLKKRVGELARRSKRRFARPITAA